MFILLWIWVSLFTGTTNAQTFYIGSGGIFYTSPGGSLYVNKNMSVDGTVSNTGTITLTGDLTVTGTWTSTGTESFSGPGIQTINSAITGTNYFGHWIKNNVSNILILADIDCDSVTFSTNGLIDATISSPDVKIKSGLITAIKGYNSSRYFLFEDDQGSLSRNITSLESYVFPIGTPTATYRRIDLVTTSLGVTGSSFVNAKLKDYSPGIISYSRLFSTGFSGTVPPGICIAGSNPQLIEFNCMTDHYWKLSGPNDYRFKTYVYATPCSPSGQGPRRVLKAPSGSGFWTSNVETVSGTLTTELCENSDWTAAANPIPGGTYQGITGDYAIAGSTGTLLPVELLSLTATGLSKSILVQWATVSELNNDYFNIQRSTDAENWFTIGQSDGQGTTNYRNDYFHEDRNVVSNVDYYYRLEQVDFDGTRQYSSIVSASISGGATDAVLFPSVTTGSVHASTVLQQVMVYDLLGKKIREFHDTNDVTIFDLPSGMYLFEITTADGLKKIFKITKQ